MMRKTVEITGVPVDNVTMEQALERVKQFLQEDRVHTVYTPNAEIMMDARRNPEFKKILCSADLCIADGAGVVLASRILGRPLPEKVAGIDLSRNIFTLDIGRKLRVYLFGGKPGIAETAAENILKDNNNVEIVGCRNGYFSKEEEPEIVKSIAAANPDLLLVALGKIKQESFIYNHRDELNSRVCIGVGGTLDVIAGKATLAPEFFRRHGLEWLYRLYKEPKRFIRMLDLPKYVILTLAIKLRIKK